MCTIFKIKGGKSLKGTIIPQGAKNEALQIICAVLLTNEKVRIYNIPEIEDVKSLMKIISNLGVNIKKHKKGEYTFQTNNIHFSYMQSEKFKKDSSLLRGSIMLIGPLLTKYGKAFIPNPGGDKIGRRRLDTHFQALIDLGAHFKFNKQSSFYELYSKELCGKNIILHEASITGTANILMASVLAKGNTTIYNAACEPYIQQLCKMLNKMGAKIVGIGSNLISIKGVKKLFGTNHTILPDMIEIGSWIGLAAMTHSELIIKNVSWKNLGIIPNTFRNLGIKLNKINDDIHIPYQEYYKIKKFIDGSILTIYDAPWPGFTPDLLSIILVTATQGKGSVLIHQKMFESRLFFTDKLIDMGAQIILCDPHRATVIGLNNKIPLRGTTMTSPDIRAGNALLIAALSAQGESYIYNIEQIDRGYENIDKRLQKLGAEIIRINI